MSSPNIAINENKKSNKTGFENFFYSPLFTILFFVLLTIVFLIFRLKFIHLPLHRDEGLYGYIAQEILRGRVPVLDVVEIKFPLTYYFFTIPLLIFGKTSVIGIRIAAMFVWFASIFFVYFTARNLFPEQKAVRVVSALMMLLCSISISLNTFIYYTEIIAQFSFLLALMLFSFFVRDGGKSRLSFLLVLFSGFFWMAATMTRQTHLLFVLIFICWFIAERKKIGENFGFGKACFVFVLGSVLNVLLVALLLGVNNFIPVFQILGYLSKIYIHSTPPYWDLNNLMEIVVLLKNFLVENTLLSISAMAGLIALIVTKSKKWVILVWFLCGILALIFSTLHFSRNIIQLAPALCVLAGFFIAKAFHFAADKKILKTALVILILAGIAANIAVISPFYFKYTDIRELSQLVYGEIFCEALDVSDYIKARTNPDDYIYVWGVEWEVYFYTDRRSPSRHICLNNFLRGAYSIYKDKADILDPFVPHQTELLIDLHKNKPRYIIMAAPFFDYGLREYFLPKQFEKFLNSEYIPDEGYKGKNFAIFRRKQ